LITKGGKMTRERTDVSNDFELFPEGHYRFTVVGVPGKYKTGKSSYRKWKLSYNAGGGIIKMTTFILFPWDSKELLLAVGGKEASDGSIDWDDEEVARKEIEADVVWERCNDDKVRAKIKNVKEAIPF